VSWLRNTLRAARAALKAGRWQRARELYAQVLAVDAGHAEALEGTNRARAKEHAALDELRERGARLLGEGRSDEACTLLRSAVERSPRDWRAQELLGQARLQDGQLEAAERSLRESLRLQAHNARAQVWLADVFSAKGRRQAAETALRDALKLEPALGQAWLRLAHLRSFERNDDPDLASMSALVADPALGAVDAEALHFALGKAYDDLDRADEAFAELERAHELARQRQPFDTDSLLGLMDRIASVCNEEFFARARGLGCESSLPVFVVGLPRCGSTLVEQIIASHPRAYGVGELRALPRLSADLPGLLATRTPFPECLPELDRQTAATVAARYLERLRRDAPDDVLRVCDKMLSNLLLVGLIAVLFPNATVIHCKRHLLDLALSIYLHSFSGSGVGYAHRLEDIGKYHLKCQQLMAHWQRVSPIRIVELEYEALVREQQSGVRSLIGAVGLDWDPRCLESHLAARHVRTVSSWQVRQPIHERSVARWRRYESKLAPLLKYLDYEP
jgi:hypothetical protein